MCFFGSSKTKSPEQPVRYTQQKEPTRTDTQDARARAAEQRRRATSTILAKDVDGVDSDDKKTLLGG